MAKSTYNNIQELTDEITTITNLNHKMTVSIQVAIRPLLNSDVIEKLDAQKEQDAFYSHDKTIEMNLHNMHETMKSIHNNTEKIIGICILKNIDYAININNPMNMMNKRDVLEHIYDLSIHIQNKLEIVELQNKAIQDMITDAQDIDMSHQKPIFQTHCQLQLATGAAAYKVDELCEEIKAEELSNVLQTLLKEENQIDL